MNIFSFTERGSILDVRIWRLQMSDSDVVDPHAVSFKESTINNQESCNSIVLKCIKFDKNYELKLYKLSYFSDDIPC